MRTYELATGVTVDYYEDIVDDEAWLASVGPELAATTTTSARTSTWWATTRRGALIAASGGLATLTAVNIPNRAHLRPELAAPGFDPKRHHSLPWTAGMAGLAYNPALTGRPITAATDLFDPAFKGRVTMLADRRDGLGMVMLEPGQLPGPRPTWPR